MNNWGAKGTGTALLWVLAFTFCLSPIPGLAQAEESGSEATESEAAPKPEPLKGGVKGTAIRLEDGLKTISISTKMVQTSTGEIMKEVTRKETTVAKPANYIGNGIVIPALGGDPTGVVRVGELPARRKRLEAFIGSSEESFAVLQNHVDALIVPNELGFEEAHKLWEGMRSALGAARGNLNKLKELSAQEKLENKAIGKSALAVYDSMTAVEKMREQMDEILRFMK